MNRITQFLISCIVLGIWLAPPAALAQQYELSNGLITGGSRNQITNGTLTITGTLGQSGVGNILGVTPEGDNFGAGLGIWSFFQLQPMTPFVFASDGEQEDRIEVTWSFDPLSPATDDGYKIYRNGSHLATLNGNAEAYQDFNVIAGQVYNYGVRGVNEYGDGALGTDPGFLNPNGRITGRVVSSNQRPLRDVEITVTPNLGRSLDFNGSSDYVELPVLFDEAEVPTALTVEAWLYLRSDDQPYVFYHGDNAEFALQPDQFSVKLAGLDWVHAPTAEPIPTDSWYHIAGTWLKGDSLSFYINGELVSRVGVADVDLNDAGPDFANTAIGCYNQSGSYVDGMIDDVRVWNVARSQESIERDYDRTLSGDETGLWAYWKLDEGISTRIYDLTTRDLDGLAMSDSWTGDIPDIRVSDFTDTYGNYQVRGIYYSTGTTFHVTPSKTVRIGRSLNFDGVDDYVEIAKNDTLELQNFTLEAWIKVNGNQNNTILSYGQSAHDGGSNATESWAWTYRAGDETFRLRLHNADGQNFLDLYEPGSVPLSSIANEWVHAAATWDGETATLYLDATLVAETTVSTDSIYYDDGTDSRLRIGTWFGMERWFDGPVDEVRIWDHARSQTDIEATRTDILEGTEDGLVAYWQLNEGNGDMIAEKTDGTLSGYIYGSDDTIWSQDYPLNEIVEHEFDPEERLVTLDPSNTSTDAVDFTDLTLVPVAGVVRYEGTTCFAENIEILVDGESLEPPLLTNESGEFIAEFEPGASHELTPSFGDHQFIPEHWTVEDVVTPVSGILFKDQTQRSLTINVYGGSADCWIPLLPDPDQGNLTVELMTLSDCYSASENMTTDNTTNGGTTITFHNLPPTSFIVSVDHTDPDITFTSRQISVAEADEEMDFEYHSEMVVEMSGSGFLLPNNCDGSEPFTGPDGEDLDALPVLYQDNYRSVQLEIYEDYDPYGGICPVDTGYVNFYNTIADEDTTIFFGDGAIDQYKFRVGLPNIASGGDHPYQKSLEAVAHELVQNPNNGDWISGRQANAIQWVYVHGERRRGAQFTSLHTGEDPLLVLRDPPGDGSYAYYTEGETYATTKHFMLLDEDTSRWKTLNATLPDFELVLPFVGTVFKSDLSLDIKDDWIVTVKKESSQEVTIKAEYTETFSTSSDQVGWVEGRNIGDIFVGIGYNLMITDADVFAFNDTTCSFSLDLEGIIDELGINSMHVYSEYHIRNSLIPDLEHSYEQTDDDSLKVRIANSIINWEELVAMNDSLKAATDETTMINSVAFDGLAGGYEWTSTVTHRDLFTQLTYAEQTTAVDFKIGQRINGVGSENTLAFKSVTGRIPTDVFHETETIEQYTEPDDQFSGTIADLQGTYYSVEDGFFELAESINNLVMMGYNIYQIRNILNPGANLKTIAKAGIKAGGATGQAIDFLLSHVDDSYTELYESTTTRGYYLDDDDPGDNFLVDIYRDETFGGLIFKTVAGASKCPWEENTAKREMANLTSSSAEPPPVDPDEPVVIDLYLTNYTETDESSWFIIKPLQEFNPDGATIRLNGDNDSDGLLVTLPALETVQITMTIERGPIAYDYPNLAVLLTSECEYDLALAGLNNDKPFIADTLFVTAHFKQPCSDINIAAPTNDWLVGQNDNNTLWITLNDYTLENAPFSDIQLQYRQVSMGGSSTPGWQEDGQPRVLDFTSPPPGYEVIETTAHFDDPLHPNQGMPVLKMVRVEPEPVQPFGHVERGHMINKPDDKTGRATAGERLTYPIEADAEFSFDPGDGAIAEPMSGDWVIFETIPYSDLPQDQDYFTYAWELDDYTDGAFEIRAIINCSTTAGIPGATQVVSGIVERYPPAVYGSPQPADAVLEAGDEISVTFTEEIDCSNLVEGDAAPPNGTLNNVRVYDTSLGAVQGLVDIDVSCYENNLLITPMIPNYYFENKTLRAQITGIKDLYNNALQDTVSWEFWVNRNPIAWSGGDISASKYEDEAITVTRQLVNNGGVSMGFDFLDLNPNPGRAVLQPPDWMSVEPTSGMVNPGTAQTISVTFASDLAGGIYEDSLIVRTTKGDEPLFSSLHNYCYAPDWTVDPAQYSFNMTVTARVEFGDYAPIDTAAVVIGAFINGEPFGMAQLEYVAAADQHLGFLVIHGNNSEVDQMVTLRVWDGLSCTELGQDVDAFPFEANGVMGDGQSPYVINLSPLLVQGFDLAAGWNWISFNVNTPNDSINFVLDGLSPVANDIIKSHGGDFAQFVTDVGWVPFGMQLDNETSYMIRSAENVGFEVSGFEIDLPNTPIALAAGWNGVAYQPQSSLAVADALQSLEPATGDLIKNQYAFAQFVASMGWIGSLNYLQPDSGFMLKISAADTLIYPDPAAVTAVDPGGLATAAGEMSVSGPGKQDRTATSAGLLTLPTVIYPDDWVLNPSAFENNMTITGIVAVDGIEQTEAIQAVGAFVDGECRGIAEPIYLEGLDQYLVFLMVYSNAVSDELIEFRLLSLDEQVVTANEQVEFVANEMVGGVETPYIWTTEALAIEDPAGAAVPTVFSLSQNFPNPFNPVTTIRYGLPVSNHVEIVIYNAVGQRVKTLVHDEQNAGYQQAVWHGRNDAGQRVHSGVYFYRMTTDTGFDQTRKLLLLK